MRLLLLYSAKLLAKLGKFLGRGSVYPGYFLLHTSKNPWKYFTPPTQIIAVTGSSGKGAVSQLIREGLESANKTVVHNDAHSNLDTGILTTFTKNSNRKGELKADFLVLEIDERFLKKVTPYLKINHLIVTNVTRDQPPRQGDIDIIFDQINDATDAKTTIITNGDDPFLRQFELKNKKVVYYGIEKTKYSTKTQPFPAIDCAYCPKCATKLTYTFYHYDSVGDFVCSKCHLKRNHIAHTATRVDYDQKTAVMDGIKITLHDDMLYVLYNILAAHAALKQYGIDATSAIENSPAVKNYSHQTYPLDSRALTLYSAKAENAGSYNQVTLRLARDKQPKTLVVGWQYISRRYDFADISWLYDINFEQIPNVETAVTIGPNHQDIATRLRLAGIENIHSFADIDSAAAFIRQKTHHDIHAFLSFEQTAYIDALKHALATKEAKDA